MDYLNKTLKFLTKKNYLHAFLTILFSLPLSIFLLTSYFTTCENTFVQVSFETNTGNCFCKNFVTDESLKKYLAKNRPLLNTESYYDFEYPISLYTIEGFKYAYFNKYNFLDEIININFDIEELTTNFQIPYIVNNYEFQPIQAISLLELSNFDELKSSLKVEQFKLNTTKESYTLMLTLRYNYIYLVCMITTFNQTFYDTNFIYDSPEQLYNVYIKHQLNDNYYVSCHQFSNPYAPLPDVSFIQSFIETNEFSSFISNVNKSIINITENDLFNIEKPKYCIPDYCHVANCFAYPLLSVFILIASCCNLIYLFIKLILNYIYKVKRINTTEKKVEMVIIST